MNCGSLTELNKSLLFGVIVAALVVILPASTAFATIDASLQMQLGNPSGAIVDTNNHAHYLVQRTVEAIDYSDNLREPNWASSGLYTSQMQGVSA